MKQEDRASSNSANPFKALPNKVMRKQAHVAYNASSTQQYQAEKEHVGAGKDETTQGRQRDDGCVAVAKTLAQGTDRKTTVAWMRWHIVAMLRCTSGK